MIFRLKGLKNIWRRGDIMAKVLDRVVKGTIKNEVYTHAQAKEDTFTKKTEIKRYYDEMEAEYKLKEQLIEARIAAGLNQKQLAEIVDTKQSAISRWERDDCFQMSIRQLRKVAHAMGKEVEIRLV